MDSKNQKSIKIRKWLIFRFARCFVEFLPFTWVRWKSSSNRILLGPEPDQASILTWKEKKNDDFFSRDQESNFSDSLIMFENSQKIISFSCMRQKFSKTMIGDNFARKLLPHWNCEKWYFFQVFFHLLWDSFLFLLWNSKLFFVETFSIRRRLLLSYPDQKRLSKNDVDIL